MPGPRCMRCAPGGPRRRSLLQSTTSHIDVPTCAIPHKKTHRPSTFACRESRARHSLTPKSRGAYNETSSCQAGHILEEAMRNSGGMTLSSMRLIDRRTRGIAHSFTLVLGLLGASVSASQAQTDVAAIAHYSGATGRRCSRRVHGRKAADRVLVDRRSGDRRMSERVPGKIPLHRSLRALLPQQPDRRDHAGGRGVQSGRSEIGVVETFISGINAMRMSTAC